MSIHLPARALVAAAALFAAGCSPEGEPRSAEAAPASGKAAPVREITVTAGDFYFLSPSSVPAGLTRIRLVNRGPEFHHVQLVKIQPGHTLHEFLERVAAGELTPRWVSYVGGPNSPAPGGESEAIVDLEPGSYAMICVIPSPDGKLHVAKGMVRPLTVTPPAAGRGAEPAADVRMLLDDYSYDITPEIRAGRRTVRVENVAGQPHEVVFLKLAPGKSVQDATRFLEKHDGAPPFELLGGTTLLSRGEVNFLSLDFAPGEYALICMVPDAGDGRPHVAHGMVRQITVR